MLMNPEQKRHTFTARWERGGVTEEEKERRLIQCHKSLFWLVPVECLSLVRQKEKGEVEKSRKGQKEAC